MNPSGKWRSQMTRILWAADKVDLWLNSDVRFFDKNYLSQHVRSAICRYWYDSFYYFIVAG